jgi:hemolysin III
MSTTDQLKCSHGHRPVDEHANFVTHAFGFALATVAAAFLMFQVLDTNSLRLQVACAVYCITLVALYGASTLSHSFHDLDVRRFFRTADQACIFILIAGTYTPFVMIGLWHGWWPALLVAMWVLALLGVAMTLSVRNLSATAKLAYGVLGWLPVISLNALAENTSPSILPWVMAGGACYCLGTIFLALDRVKYFHAVWHILVIAGGTCHHVAISRYLLVS